MKLLLLGDQESRYLWDCYRPGVLSEYDLILSAGDLKASYLSFLVTMARAPLLYVHGKSLHRKAVTALKTISLCTRGFGFLALADARFTAEGRTSTASAGCADESKRCGGRFGKQGEWIWFCPMLRLQDMATRKTTPIEGLSALWT